MLNLGVMDCDEALSCSCWWHASSFECLNKFQISHFATWQLQPTLWGVDVDCGDHFLDYCVKMQLRHRQWWGWIYPASHLLPRMHFSQCIFQMVPNIENVLVVSGVDSNQHALRLWVYKLLTWNTMNCFLGANLQLCSHLYVAEYTKRYC